MKANAAKAHLGKIIAYVVPPLLPFPLTWLALVFGLLSYSMFSFYYYLIMGLSVVVGFLFFRKESIQTKIVYLLLMSFAVYWLTSFCFLIFSRS